MQIHEGIPGGNTESQSICQQGKEKEVLGGRDLVEDEVLHTYECYIQTAFYPKSKSPYNNSSSMVIDDGQESGSGNGASEKAGETLCCASCGIVDDVKLMTCDANCKLVRYCSIACQREHRPQHKEECKKRVAELRDELLFAQPKSSHFGDCPICFLPLAINERSRNVLMSCCSKLICDGCFYANKIRELNASLKRTCPFCRHSVPVTKIEADANVLKRVEANDPVATHFFGKRRYDEGDYGSAVEYLTKAAGLGDTDAHHQLSVMYLEGGGVEKDEKKAVYHAEEAAIAGHPLARFNLGSIEWYSGSKERAMKHYIIAANHGHDKSVGKLKQGYLRGLVSKEDFAAALRAHQAAVDATKSPQRQREAAAELAKL
eukprot:scaffold14465_cov77-Skeletonema_dohrnii-CCMP3373.AAC.1